MWCWWLIFDVGAKLLMLVTWLVTNIQNLSPTHLVTKIRHQHRCNRQNPVLTVFFSSEILRWLKMRIIFASNSILLLDFDTSRILKETQLIEFWATSRFWAISGTHGSFCGFNHFEVQSLKILKLLFCSRGQPDIRTSGTKIAVFRWSFILWIRIVIIFLFVAKESKVSDFERIFVEHHQVTESISYA